MFWCREGKFQKSTVLSRMILWKSDYQRHAWDVLAQKSYYKLASGTLPCFVVGDWEKVFILHFQIFLTSDCSHAESDSILNIDKKLAPWNIRNKRNLISKFLASDNFICNLLAFTGFGVLWTEGFRSIIRISLYFIFNSLQLKRTQGF